VEQPVSRFSKMRVLLVDSFPQTARDTSVHSLVDIMLFPNELLVLPAVTMQSRNAGPIAEYCSGKDTLFAMN